VHLIDQIENDRNGLVVDPEIVLQVTCH
jgi:hypothetical protein